MLPARHLIFTDLDGTLLDHHTYSWDAAKEALAEIKRRRVPLIFVTSKTRAELEVLRRKLDHVHPFVTENGGGIFIPHGYFRLRVEGTEKVGPYHCRALARPYPEAIAALEELAADARVGVVGFHQMSVREIAQNTGLSMKQAELARRREFDEPFFFTGVREQDTERFVLAARRRGMKVTRGGRFWHLATGGDKGSAVRYLTKLYDRSAHRRLRSVGLGDSLNDLSLLTAVDKAVLLPQPDGSFDHEVLARLTRFSRGIAPGPAGWNQAVLLFLRTA